MTKERLEIGTKVYYVYEDNNVFSRKKITMKDTSGVEWYRYDKPLRTQNIEEHTIVGRVLKTVEGTISSNETYFDEYHLEDGQVIDESSFNEPDYFNGYFLNKDEALKWIEDRKAEVNKIGDILS